MLTCFSSQAHFLYLFHFPLEQKFSLHASELHKTKFQTLSALLFTSFLSEQTVDMAVVSKLQGHLLLSNYSRTQHRTQKVLLLIFRANPLGDDEKAGTVLNKRISYPSCCWSSLKFTWVMCAYTHIHTQKTEVPQGNALLHFMVLRPPRYECTLNRDPVASISQPLITASNSFPFGNAISGSPSESFG